MASEDTTTPYGWGGTQTHYSSADPVTLRPTGYNSSGTQDEGLPTDPVSSIFYWSVNTTNMMFVDRVTFDHVSWYGTNVKARSQIDKVAEGCTKFRDPNGTCYVASTQFYSGKDEEWAISQDILKAYRNVVVESQNQRSDEEEDISRYFRTQQVAQTTLQDIRRIEGQLEQTKCTPKLANGFLVLGSTIDPMRSGSSWIGTSAEGEITDFKVLVSPDESNGLFYNHKKSVLDKLGSAYWSRKVSNDLPSWPEACGLAEGYSGCEVIKVWHKTLEEMQALERVQLAGPMDDNDGTPGGISKSAKDAWDW
ncbi:uncharacterized protein L199_007013 [Kwoniella botswanensis]|uniref:uncharacterized protein n=1 Tax=Kwoniella botswanensis TaxID=1268659 RepID=UPI00315C737D